MGIMRARRTQADSYNKWAVLFTVVVMSFMSTLDSSVVNVALPAMQRELGVSAGDIQWVSSVYLLVCCAAAIPFGRLGDRGGKVRYFQLGVALFTLGSLRASVRRVPFPTTWVSLPRHSPRRSAAAPLAS